MVRANGRQRVVRPRASSLRGSSSRASREREQQCAIGACQAKQCLHVWVCMDLRWVLGGFASEIELHFSFMARTVRHAQTARIRPNGIRLGELILQSM
jgi:hypothetical protein